MIVDTIDRIFNFLPETNLVEEDFYNHKGNYPVFSGQTENNGIVAYIDSYNQDEPCITFATYGTAGKMYYREGKYTIGRNCMGLRPKEKFKNKIDMQWFVYKYQNLFYRLKIGDLKGQRSLNRKLLEKVKISIPDEEIQTTQLNAYKRIQSFLDKIEELLQVSRTFLKSNIQITEYDYEPSIEELFHIYGGNSGLTEEFTYYNKPKNQDEGIPILSGATVKANLMGCVKRKSRPHNKQLKIFSEPSLLVVRKGIAGQMEFVNRVEYTANDDAYILMLREKWKKKVNLRWFMYHYQELFYNFVTSKTANATFSKQYAKNQKVKIPKIDFQSKISEGLLKIDRMIEELEEMKKSLENLLEYEII